MTQKGNCHINVVCWLRVHSVLFINHLSVVILLEVKGVQFVSVHFIILFDRNRVDLCDINLLSKSHYYSLFFDSSDNKLWD